MDERYEIITYTTKDGRRPFSEWLQKLKDLDAKKNILRRIQRMELGNFGDYKSLREGIFELRIDTGPGYRVYYTHRGKEIVLLLLGGDKRKQEADINKAIEYNEELKRNK